MIAVPMAPYSRDPLLKFVAARFPAAIQRGAAGGTRLGLMLEYQKSPNPGAACRAATVFASSAQRETRLLARSEGGAATTRFLVLQHERRRRATLGPRAGRRLVEQLK